MASKRRECSNRLVSIMMDYVPNIGYLLEAWRVIQGIFIGLIVGGIAGLIIGFLGGIIWGSYC